MYSTPQKHPPAKIAVSVFTAASGSPARTESAERSETSPVRSGSPETAEPSDGTELSERSERIAGPPAAAFRSEAIPVPTAAPHSPAATSGSAPAAGTNPSESELTQWRVFLGVNPSPVKTWPKWASQRAQTISVRRPSASGVRRTAPGISSSKLGQPHPASNLSSER